MKLASYKDYFQFEGRHANLNNMNKLNKLNLSFSLKTYNSSLLPCQEKFISIVIKNLILCNETLKIPPLFPWPALARPARLAKLFPDSKIEAQVDSATPSVPSHALASLTRLIMPREQSLPARSIFTRFSGAKRNGLRIIAHFFLKQNQKIFCSWILKQTG